jgi:molecular chaperone IbpA|tara:strand:- start:1314 stop:1775 length:462 start_codon:yes stop_codon:yes gene_type:complete
MTKDMFALLNSPFFVGFDRIHDRLHEFNDSIAKNLPTYPPYNIRKVGDQYIVEMAVAGFSESDIDIQVEGDVLKVVGSITDNKDTSPYLHKGIANRGFTRTFNLAETIEVKDASLVNGMLKIFLEDIIPDNKKPRKININKEETQEESQLLNE